MRWALLVALTMLGVACGSFGAAEEPTPAPSNDGGLGADTGDAGPVITCTEEEKKTPRHCGRCGHDCGGGECNSGECQPYPIVKDVASWYLAVDGDYVYWTSRITSELSGRGDGKVWRAKKLGGGAPQEIYSSPDCFDVASIGNAVFVTVVSPPTTGSIQRIALDGANLGLVSPLAGLALEVVAHGANAYAIERASPNKMLVMDATNMPSIALQLGVQEDNFEGLATDGTYLYMVKHLATGSIVRTRLDGSGQLEMIVPSTASPRRLSVDDQYVYWSSEADFGVFRARKDGSDPAKQQIVEGDIKWGKAIVSGDRLYATLQNESQVIRAPKGGSPSEATVVKSGLDNPMGIAQDDVAIYFGEYGNAGSIWRMVK